eukprot:gene16360-4991_t
MGNKKSRDRSVEEDHTSETELDGDGFVGEDQTSDAELDDSSFKMFGYQTMWSVRLARGDGEIDMLPRLIWN